MKQQIQILGSDKTNFYGVVSEDSAQLYRAFTNEQEYNIFSEILSVKNTICWRK